VVAAAAGAGSYVAVNRYRLVEPSKAAQFEAEHAARAAAAAATPGYVSYALTPLPPSASSLPEYSATATFDSKEAYEAWMNTPARRRSHLPQGVWQYRTANKFSVPEEFCPFVTEVTANAPAAA
jgi:antibiotic biosynthesis monooxygenase (ABM) superfamily enzyme